MRSYWTKEEDAILMEAIGDRGDPVRRRISNLMREGLLPGRSYDSISCRHHRLSKGPSQFTRRQAWTQEETDLVLSVFSAVKEEQGNLRRFAKGLAKELNRTPGGVLAQWHRITQKKGGGK